MIGLVIEQGGSARKAGDTPRATEWLNGVIWGGRKVKQLFKKRGTFAS